MALPYKVVPQVQPAMLPSGDEAGNILGYYPNPYAGQPMFDVDGNPLETRETLPGYTELGRINDGTGPWGNGRGYYMDPEGKLVAEDGTYTGGYAGLNYKDPTERATIQRGLSNTQIDYDKLNAQHLASSNAFGSDLGDYILPGLAAGIGYMGLTGVGTGQGLLDSLFGSSAADLDAISAGEQTLGGTTSAAPSAGEGFWEAGMSGGAPADATGGAGSLAGTAYTPVELPSIPTPSLPSISSPAVEAPTPSMDPYPLDPSGNALPPVTPSTPGSAAGVADYLAQAGGAAGAVAAGGAASGGSVWDDIAKALGITKDAAGGVGTFNSLKDLFGGLVGAYGANDVAKTYADAMKYAADKADPFGSQRPYYQTMFKGMNDGTNNPATTPWMSNLTNTTIDNTLQRLTSKYGGEVNSLGVKNNLTNQVNATNTPVMMDYLKTIGNAAGMNIQPSSGQIAAQGAQGSAGLNNAMYGNLGVAGNSLLDMLYKGMGSNSGNGYNNTPTVAV